MTSKPRSPNETLPPFDSTKTVPPFNPDITNPRIELPPTDVHADDLPDNPLEALVPDVDEQMERLERDLRALNRAIAGKTYEYGGMVLRNPRVNPKLELEGEDENGVKFVIQREDVGLFIKSGRE